MPEIELELAFEWEANSFEDAFDELEDDVTNVIRGLSVDMWYGIVHRTPQAFGRMVVSWTYSLNRPLFVDRSHQAPPFSTHTIRNWVRNEDGSTEYLDTTFEAPAFHKGSLPAIRIANAINAGADELFKLGDEIFISNGANHGDGAYSGAVEYGEVKLRSINNPGNAVERTMTQVASRYSEDVSDAAADKLRKKKIY